MGPVVRGGAEASAASVNEIDTLRVVDPRASTAALRLRELRDDTEDDVPPTEYAFDRACRLVLALPEFLSEGVPDFVAYTDEAGGIRCEWQRAARHVRLIIPPRSQGRHYIYHEDGDQYSVEDRVSPDTLAAWLRWLAESEQPIE